MYTYVYIYIHVYTCLYTYMYIQYLFVHTYIVYTAVDGCKSKHTENPMIHTGEFSQTIATVVSSAFATLSIGPRSCICMYPYI